MSTPAVCTHAVQKRRRRAQRRPTIELPQPTPHTPLPTPKRARRKMRIITVHHTHWTTMAIVIGAAVTTAMSIRSAWLGLTGAIFTAMAGGICGLITIAMQRHDVEPPREGRLPYRPTLKSRE